MKKIIENDWLKIALILVIILSSGTGIFERKTSAQTGCADCVPDEVIFQLTNQADLAAVAAQYHLDAVPLRQVGTPPSYRMRINNGQTPTQVVAAMAADGRVGSPE